MSASATPSAEQTSRFLSRENLWNQYCAVRGLSESLCRPLVTEDYVVQTMADVSPPKWHLAHNTWFFENFLLIPFLPTYKLFHRQFGYLFNSYYETVGSFHARPRRGLLSRPTVAEVYAYRAHVNYFMQQLIELASTEVWQEIADLVVLGLHHEQQHQELLLTDIKHIFATNPLRLAYQSAAAPIGNTVPLAWLDYAGGIRQTGHAGAGFAFDNEMPRHRVFLERYRLATRLITNGDYLEFMQAGGYSRPEHWLSDGWRTVQEQGWQAPLYWEKCAGRWQVMTLCGLREMVESEPVCHISYYEADAYARWAGKRLPTEAEWENAAAQIPIAGNLLESGLLHPAAASMEAHTPAQMFGDVWEWTQSPYVPYPGYQTPRGPLGEYNGKFMCNQMVLRGGSCVSSASHLRASYRNFFPPEARWQFSGLRLAEDA